MANLILSDNIFKYLALSCIHAVTKYEKYTTTKTNCLCVVTKKKSVWRKKIYLKKNIIAYGSPTCEVVRVTAAVGNRPAAAIWVKDIAHRTNPAFGSSRLPPVGVRELYRRTVMSRATGPTTISLHTAVTYYIGSAIGHARRLNTTRVPERGGIV